MNLFQKIFCRSVQLAFRLAQPVLPYRDPEILDKVEEIPDLLSRKGYASVLLVTDDFLYTSGATATLERQLEQQKIRCVVYHKTRPNPTVDNVEEALTLYHQHRCQALIAFGGGSSMDCAKAVGARVAYPKRSLDRLKGNLKVWRRLPDLIAIPTTAGTGSETTVTAVITDPQTRHKYTMNNFTMIPSYAVLDPQVTITLPPHLTATTGMDALTHAIEAYIGRSTCAQTRRLALEAVELIFQNLLTAWSHGDDVTARRNMLLASHKAGIAFSKSYVGYIHGVAHSLGGQYNIPHGLANAVLLPIGLEQYGECIHKKLRPIAIAAGVAKETDSPRQASVALIGAIYEMNDQMGIGRNLTGIRKEDIPQMAKHAASESNPLYPVPKLMNAKELEIFYNLVMKGTN